jgi:oxygen-independent coproporphyrinogen-3 oxidase
MKAPLSLYVHLPFCTVKCGYCDFNAYAGQERLMPAYSEALQHEAQLWAPAMAGRGIETLYFGGGTPSLTPLDQLQSIFEALRSASHIDADAEVTLEAIPDSASEAYLRGLRDLGVNRLSLGMQSFHDDELRALDRLHTAEDNRAAMRAARVAGFDNVSFDLIFGLPEQALERWRSTLDEAIALEPEHLSLYALTVEEGTPLARDVARGRTPAPDPDAQADQYEHAQQRLACAGYEHYEISTWARPGRRSRHNLTYWRGGDYLGLGAGAHSYLDGLRHANVAVPARYTELVNQSWAASEQPPTSHVATRETPSPQLAMADALILGLRLLEGVSRAEFRTRFGVDPLRAFEVELGEPLAAGLAEAADDRLRLTERGRLLANEVFARLLPD